MGHERACLRTTFCKAKSEDDVVQSPLQETEKILTRHAPLLQCCAVITSELTLGDSINPPSLLFFPELSGIIGDSSPPELGVFTMFSRGITPSFERAFWCKAALPF